jgi:hypothetical protein
MSKLEKAVLKDLDRGGEFPVCFNPKELSVEKQVQWKPQEGAISDEPPEEFGKPTPATLTVTLHFDTYETKGSVVTEFTQKLEKLALIIDDKKRPPLCQFVWGKFVFQGVVESLTQKFTMFLSNGTPVRCEATLKMKKASSAATGKSGK